MARAPLLRLEGAAFGYGGRAIVSGLELAIEAGQFLGIVGPNGAGKTTLFRGLLGLIPPLAGRCERSPEAVLGYVPQREKLDANYPLSAREVVEMGAYGRLAGLRSISRADRALALDLLARVGLAAEAGLPFSELSGGQRQRVLLARALLVRPTVLLLDEPTSGVSAEEKFGIMQMVLDAVRAEGATVLFVEHDMEVVSRFAQRVLAFYDGRVIADAAPQVALADPEVKRHVVGRARA
jgi:ABC-type Mn2+/Zn2+ transport system ATPase subunit